jgi:hypothetical protein
MATPTWGLADDRLPFELSSQDDERVGWGTRENFTLRNNTMANFDIALHVEPGDGATKPPLATVDPSSVALRAGSSAVITVSLAVPTGTGAGKANAVFHEAVSGFIVAVGGPTGAAAVVRQPFSIAPQMAKPLTATWWVTSYRWKPFGQKLHNHVLPLENDPSCEQLELPETLGGLAAKEGGAARVRGTCTTGEVVAGRTGVALSFPGLHHTTGDYTGKLDLAPTNEKEGEVELTVRRTDFILLPLILLLVGIFGAVLLARWSNRLSPLSEREEETWRLLARQEEAQVVFADRSRNKTWHGYDLQPSLGQKLSEVRTALAGLGRRFGQLDEQAPEYEAITNTLTDLDGIITAWPEFASRLGELEEALEEVQEEAPEYRPPGASGPIPAFVASAERLLMGSPLPIEEARAYMEKTEKTARMAESWLAHVRAIEQLKDAAMTVEAAMTDLPPDHPDWSSLREATRKLSEAAEELFSAEDADKLEQWGTVNDIDIARSRLNGLAWHMKRERRPAALGSAPDAAVQEDVSGASGLAKALSPEGQSADAIARQIAGTRRRRNLLALLVLATITVFTGLTLLYFDRPFGTLRDYVAIMAWGFGAQAALEALVGGLDRLVGGGRSTAGPQPLLWFPS